MKLLIVTQVMDRSHPILGFFHRWVEEFAKHCDQVHVICLEAGDHNLPYNVVVHSLGKEKKAENCLVYIWRYLSLVWKLRKKYDSVFTHMNPEYTIVGYPIWFVTRKQIGMWYAHGAVSLRLKIATLMSKNVFTSTPQGFRLNIPKRKIVGQGIDTILFTPADTETHSEELQLVTVGRMTPAKNIDTLLRSCAVLKGTGQPFSFSIVGGAVTDQEKVYERQMMDLTHELGLDDEVVFVGSVKQSKLPEVLRRSDLFIHDGQTGSLDKVLLEVMASATFVISSNESYKALMENAEYNTVYTTGDFETLANMVQEFLMLPKEKKENVINANRQLVKTDHSLVTFVQKIVSEYTM